MIILDKQNILSLQIKIKNQLHYSRREGFTLVELLVVISIVAILSAIAIVNLNTARNKGRNAAVKANLVTLYSAAELYYDNKGDYDGFCDDVSIRGVTTSIQNINNFGCAEDVNPKACVDCDDDADAWIVFGRLYDGKWFCVDGLGTQSVTSTPNSPTCL